MENNRYCQLLTKIFCSLAIVIFVQIANADQNTEYSIEVPNLNNQETYINIEPSKNNDHETIELKLSSKAVPTIVFEKADTKIIKIDNNLKDQINIKKILYYTDAFTQAPTNNSIKLSNISKNTIDKNEYAELLIEASSTVSSSIYNDGTTYSIIYTINNDETPREINFKVKIEYNNDIQFENRNLELMRGEKKYLSLKNNHDTPIKITDVSIGEEADLDINIDKHNIPIILNPDESYKIAIVAENDNKAGAIPVHITYEKNGKEILTTAALFLNKESANLFFASYRTTMSTIVKEFVKNRLKSEFKKFEDSSDLISCVNVRYLASVNADRAKKAEENHIDGNPRDGFSQRVVKVIAKSSSNIALEGLYPSSTPQSYSPGIRLLVYLFCNGMADVVVEPAINSYIEAGESYLPETWDNDFIVRSRKAIGRTSATITRNACNIFLKNKKFTPDTVYWVLAEMAAGISEDDKRHNAGHKWTHNTMQVNVALMECPEGDSSCKL